jgi:hypothetical protein
VKTLAKATVVDRACALLFGFCAVLVPLPVRAAPVRVSARQTEPRDRADAIGARDDGENAFVRLDDWSIS